MSAVRTCAILSSSGSLGVELERTLNRNRAVRCVHIDTTRRLALAEHSGLVLLDLVCPPRVRPRDLMGIATAGRLIAVVADNQAVETRWLPLLRRHEVRLLEVQLCSDDPFHIVRTFVQRWACRFQPRVLTRVVVNSEPQLGDLESYIRLVLLDPWNVRLPRDLANASEEPLKVLRERCAEAGFQRVEHFITAVRAVAYKHLRAMGLKSRDACAFVGIADQSNFRKQIRRAKQG